MSNQRSFARKLTRIHASDVRKHAAAASITVPTLLGDSGNAAQSTSASSFNISVPFYDVVEPLDFETCVVQHHPPKDAPKNVLTISEFPADDVRVQAVERVRRTIDTLGPDSEWLLIDEFTRNCLDAYSREFCVLFRKYEQFTTASLYQLQCNNYPVLSNSLTRHVFESDTNRVRLSLRDDKKVNRVSYTSSISTASSTTNDLGPGESVETPRGSLDGSEFDLSVSNSDSILSNITQRISVEQLETENGSKRTDSKIRHSNVLSLYPLQHKNEMVELRSEAPIPRQTFAHRILIDVLELSLDRCSEPLFASAAIYDIKLKHKVSENFYFDTNGPEVMSVLRVHGTADPDTATMSTTACFSISNPSPDLYLIIRLERVLQAGELSETVGSFLKEDKLRENCGRLGAYRMPFAWAAVCLANVFSGATVLERSEIVSTGSLDDTVDNSMGYNSDTESTASIPERNVKNTARSILNGAAIKRVTSSSLSRRGSVTKEVRAAAVPTNPGGEKTSKRDLNMDSFRPLVVTVNNFFAQENDTDIYKLLGDVRKPSILAKKLHCIPGILKLDISPVTSEVPNSITPELLRVQAFTRPDVVPVREIAEFPSKAIHQQNLRYENILYLYPKFLNFSARPGSARNIAVKVQLLASEDQRSALPAIFGTSTCKDFSTSYYCQVNYHNKTPLFDDEIKMKLPCPLSDNHHILFTFYHISCKSKGSEAIETPVGYAWHQLLRNDTSSIKVGSFSNPVLIDEKLPSSYHYILPEYPVPTLKWLDNHKPLFSFDVKALTSVHTMDGVVDNFFTLASALISNSGKYPVGVTEGNCEAMLEGAISNIHKAHPDVLVRFLNIILDRLMLLLVSPPEHLVNGKIASLCFGQIVQLVKIYSGTLDHLCDSYGRSQLFTSYIRYCCRLPHPTSLDSAGTVLKHKNSAPVTLAPFGYRHNYSSSLSAPSSSARAPYARAEDGFGSPDSSDLIDIIRDFERASKTEHSPAPHPYIALANSKKLVHEEIAVAWMTASGSAKEMAVLNSWILLELLLKSMAEFLSLTSRFYLPRHLRFSPQFLSDLANICHNLTHEIVARCHKDMKLTQRINANLAFFLRDCFSLMDRTFIFSLIRSYSKELLWKIGSQTSFSNLMLLKLEFMRIVCSHEHFVTLNLPFLNQSLPMPLASATNIATGRPASPSPSQSSRSSVGSGFLSSASTHSTGLSDLSSDFRSQHFLVGLILSDLAAALETGSILLHSKAINNVRNLLTAHDHDERITEHQLRSKVCALYLPLLGILIDSSAQLFDPFAGRNRGTAESPENSADRDYISESLKLSGGHNRGRLAQHNVNSSIAMAIAMGSAAHAPRSATNGPGGHSATDGAASRPLSASLANSVTMSGLGSSHNEKPRLSFQNTRNLLACLAWILKNVDNSTLKQWLLELTHSRMMQFIDVLQLTVSCFEYKRSVKKARDSVAIEGGNFARNSTPYSSAGGLSHKSRLASALVDSTYGGLGASEAPSAGHQYNSLRRGEALHHSGGAGDISFAVPYPITADDVTDASAAHTGVKFYTGPQNTPVSTPGSGLPPAPLAAAPVRFRKDKDQIQIRQDFDENSVATAARIEHENDMVVEGHLCTEVNLTVLDMLECIVGVVGRTDGPGGLQVPELQVITMGSGSVLSLIMRVLLHMMQCQQSVVVLENIFASQRALLLRFAWLLEEEKDLCSELCMQLLRHCSSPLTTSRSQAAATLYLMMRQSYETGTSFARVKVQITMCLSSLVTSAGNLGGSSSQGHLAINEDCLRRSLRTTLNYASQDSIANRSFTDQVKTLITNLNMILSNTVRMKELGNDFEMLMDLMFDIAKGYQTSPDLRLTWLQNMAQKHIDRKNYSEAAQCILHCAALVAEYLAMLEEDVEYRPAGCIDFLPLSHNILEESAVHDDVVSPEEEGICESHYFTEKGLCLLLEQAATYFNKAQMFEAMCQLYTALLNPIYNEQRDYGRLAEIHQILADSLKKVAHSHRHHLFGTYFRVGFYGSHFGGLDAMEFIYKEPTITQLSEISLRLETFYSKLFGHGVVEIIKDSKVVDRNNLDPAKAHIQVIFVEAHFDEWEIRRRATYFEQNYNIRRFIYSTPFTKEGPSHGNLKDQYKRKTIVTCENTFPYVKTRSRIVNNEQIILTPIESAIEDIQKKTKELFLATNQDPRNPKVLQLQLQGCIQTTVNSGPLEIANVFLGSLMFHVPDSNSIDHGVILTPLQHKLRLAFKNFARQCMESLKENKRIIGADQREYQKELEKNFQQFTEKMKPIMQARTYQEPVMV